jgi:hypothetical protein
MRDLAEITRRIRTTYGYYWRRGVLQTADCSVAVQCEVDGEDMLLHYV